MDMRQRIIDLFGLQESDFNKGTWNTRDVQGEAYLALHHAYTSGQKVVTTQINTQEELTQLLGIASEDTVQSVEGSAPSISAPWPTEKNTVPVRELNQQDEKQLRQALLATVTGQGYQVSSYREILNKRYFPMQVGVCTGDDIVVQANSPLVLNPQGHDLLIVNHNSITLEPGAEIQVEGPVAIYVQTFTKQ